MTTNTTETHESEHTSPAGIGVHRWLSQVRAFSERCLREVTGSWTMLLTVLALSPAMLLLFAMQGDPSATMIAGSAIGVGLFGAIYVCLYIFGYQLSSDLEDRRYEAYRSMPLSPSADLAGRMVAGLLLAATTFALTLLAGVATGASFGLRGPESIPIVLIAFALTCAVWMIVALPIVVYAKNERVAEYAVPMFAVVAFVLTGMNGVNAAGSWIEGAALNYLPNTLPTRVLVYHLVPTDQWVDLGIAPPAIPAGPEYVALLLLYAGLALAIGTALVTKALYGRGWWS